MNLESFLTADGGRYIPWAILGALILLVGLWHSRQDAAMARALHKKNTNDLAQSMLQRLRSRSWQLLCCLLLTASIVAYYQLQLQNQPKAAPPVLLTASPDVAKPIAAPTLSPEAEDIFTALYAPEDISDEPQSRLDRVKRQYERLFVTYFYLRRCGAVSTEDFHLINSALLLNMVQLGAPSELQRDIITAAEGSYEVLYSESPCTRQVLEKVLAPYQRYMERILEGTSGQNDPKIDKMQ